MKVSVTHCERCGKEVYYEDMFFICGLYVCRDCYKVMLDRSNVEEDDGYPD